MNYKQLNNFIENISLAFPGVKEYGSGDIYEYLNSGEHQYPTIFLTVGQITSDGTTQTLGASLFYVDRLLQDNTNKLDIQAYGMIALKAILEKMTENINGLEVTSVNYTPFTEQFADLCAGAYAQCEIQMLEQMECDSYEMGTLTIFDNGIYNVLGYEQVVVDVTKVRTIDGHSGDITLGKGLTINDDNVLSGVNPSFEAGDNITITHTSTEDGDNYKFDVPDMRYDDSEVKGMIEDVSDRIDEIDNFVPEEIVPTTTNFVAGTAYSIHNAFQRTANLFAGYWNYIKTNITDLIPSQASSSNQLADKNFVNETVAQNAANFRGNWPKWSDVPTDYNLYPVDYAGNKKPTNNDYMVVQDASDYGERPIIGYVSNILKANSGEGEYPGSFSPAQRKTTIVLKNPNDELTFDNIESLVLESLEDNYCESFKKVANGYYMYTLHNVPIRYFIHEDEMIPTYGEQVDYTGSWRFLYVGDWDTEGINGWQPAYRIGSAFTDAQQAAIDSGITADKVATYDDYDGRIDAVETDKVDKIYTASKIYGTDADGAQIGYTAGANITLDNGTINAASYDDSEVKGMIEDIAEDVEAIQSVIPDEASATNQLADKNYVADEIAKKVVGSFRGNWADWSVVPASASSYPSDYSGNHTPISNDYMVVLDASSHIPELNVAMNITFVVSGPNTFNDYSYTIGGVRKQAKLVNNSLYFGDNDDVRVFTTAAALEIYANKDVIYNGVRYASGARIEGRLSRYATYNKQYTIGEEPLVGSWRFHYQGVWTTDGKLGWKAEYQIEKPELNFKTINGESIVGTGDIVIQGGGTQRKIVCGNGICVSGKRNGNEPDIEIYQKGGHSYFFKDYITFKRMPIDVWNNIKGKLIVPNVYNKSVRDEIVSGQIRISYLLESYYDYMPKSILLNVTSDNSIDIVGMLTDEKVLNNYVNTGVIKPADNLTSKTTSPELEIYKGKIICVAKPEYTRSPDSQNSLCTQYVLTEGSYYIYKETRMLDKYGSKHWKTVQVKFASDPKKSKLNSSTISVHSMNGRVPIHHRMLPSMLHNRMLTIYKLGKHHRKSIYGFRLSIVRVNEKQTCFYRIKRD